MEQPQADIGSLHQDIARSQSIHIGDQKDVGECQRGMISDATTKQGNEILLWIQGPIRFFFSYYFSHFPTELELLIKDLTPYRDFHVL